MVNRARLRQRIAQHPNAVRFEELAGLLEAYGFVLVRSVGSHHVYARGGERLTVPYKRPHVLAAYVREALKRCGDETEERDGHE
jgi:predicted RNA binding protein YcfA (HicA-like mRNA interferase family)